MYIRTHVNDRASVPPPPLIAPTHTNAVARSHIYCVHTYAHCTHTYVYAMQYSSLPQNFLLLSLSFSVVSYVRHNSWSIILATLKYTVPMPFFYPQVRTRLLYQIPNSYFNHLQEQSVYTIGLIMRNYQFVSQFYPLVYRQFFHIRIQSSYEFPYSFHT